MGKRAREKKQARLQAVIQERQAIETREQQARRPLVRLLKRLAVAIVMTIVIIYIGQMVNQKIAKAGQAIEEQR